MILPNVSKNPSNKSLRKSPSQASRGTIIGANKKVAFKRGGMFSPNELSQAFLPNPEPMIQIQQIVKKNRYDMPRPDIDIETPYAPELSIDETLDSKTDQLAGNLSLEKL